MKPLNRKRMQEENFIHKECCVQYSIAYKIRKTLNHIEWMKANESDDKRRKNQKKETSNKWKIP